MDSRDALDVARKAGFDLVEVAPEADPPVCKFLDYGKYKYRQKKRTHKPGSQHHKMQMKEVRLTPQIDAHDLSTKLKKVRELLKRGDKVVITMRFRGRQMDHRDIGQGLLDRIVEELDGIGRLEGNPAFQGRRLVMTIIPV